MQRAGADRARRMFAAMNKAYWDEYKATGGNGPWKELQISIGDDHDTNLGHLMGIGSAYFLTLPTKIGTSWLIDGLGKSAWHNMWRRTLMLFEGNPGGDLFAARSSASPVGRSARVPTTDPSSFAGMGALQLFINRLSDHIHKRGDRTYEITLIGHSMGSMVLNEWLHRDQISPKQWRLFYKNIVFMAAACTVRDFERSVVPYLLAHQGGEQTCRFYNLTLHPTADLRERRRAADIPPRGSLLVWIDNFLGDPQTPLDRTLGRWENIVAAADVIPEEVRGQVTIKAGMLEISDNDELHGRENDLPQNHGGFRCKNYWRPDFWKAAKPRCPDSPELQEATEGLEKTKQTS